MEQVARGLDPTALRAGREAERQALREASASAGGPRLLLQARYPRLGAGYRPDTTDGAVVGCPPDLTEDALVAQTVAWYEDSEKRLTTCAVCPPAGGACDRERMLLKPGQLPVWQGESVVAAPCERYREWRLGQRLAVSNVPERYWSSKLSRFGIATADHEKAYVSGREFRTVAQQAAYDAVEAFIDGVRTGSEPWLVIQGPQATGKTYLCCSVLRGVPRMMPRKHFWYSDLNELRIQMKNYNFDSHDESPMDRLTDTELLVLDNLEATRLSKEQWLKERVEDVLYQRWNRRRATLITTHGTKEEILVTFPSITTLSEAPSCSLV